MSLGANANMHSSELEDDCLLQIGLRCRSDRMSAPCEAKVQSKESGSRAPRSSSDRFPCQASAAVALISSPHRVPPSRKPLVSLDLREPSPEAPTTLVSRQVFELLAHDYLVPFLTLLSSRCSGYRARNAFGLRSFAIFHTSADALCASLQQVAP